MDSVSGVLTAQLLSRYEEAADLVSLTDTGAAPQAVRPLRRLLWARLLGVVKSSKVAEWPNELQQHRQHFADIVRQHQEESDVKKFDANIANPLSRNTANPFLKIQANEELLQEIWKDVERTYSEVEMMSTPQARKSMQKVLFHWCRANNPSKDASESYRQGMNELVAVVYYTALQGEFQGVEPLGEELCGAAHTEADTFALFSALMELGVREMFAVEKGVAVKKVEPSPIGELPRTRADGPKNKQTALLARCSFIFDVVLKAVDERVHRCMVSHEIEPQLFLLRWLRLLFCREFSLEDTLTLWDTLFVDYYSQPGPGPYTYVGKGPAVDVASAASATMPLVDYVAVAMIHQLRRDIFNSDQQDVMMKLMKYTPVEHVKTYCEIAGRIKSGANLETSSASPVGGGLEAIGTPSTVAAAQAAKPSNPLRTSPPLLLPPGRSGATPIGPLGNDSGAVGQANGGVGVPGPLGGTGANLINAGRQALDAIGQRATAISQKLTNQGDGGSAGYPAACLGAAPAPTVSQMELAELQKKLAAAEAQKEHVRKKASEFFQIKQNEWSEKTATLESRAAVAEARVEELERRLAEKDAAPPALATNPEEIASASSAVAEAAALQQRVVELEEAVRSATDANNAVSQEKASAEQRAAQLQTDLAEQASRCAALEAQLAQHGAERDELQQRVLRLEAALEAELAKKNMQPASQTVGAETDAAEATEVPVAQAADEAVNGGADPDL